ncbi:MAG TPA: UDP-N-acetylglucosamine 2-epimerase (non-hydrolyzing), partial [Cytophagaceae bacterium]
HYDHNMSGVFFEELNISAPRYNLHVGSGYHGKQTGEMLIGIEEVLIEDRPDAVLVYGDTNSTLGAALAASKLKIPVIHVEAGLRSFNKNMPEEINRIVCDHVSSYLFVPTDTALKNLISEGFRLNGSDAVTISSPRIVNCGDVMYDNCLFYSKNNEEGRRVLGKFNIKGEYCLVTIHRESNTDNTEDFKAIIEAILEISIEQNILFVFPIHPRTLKKLNSLEVNFSSRVHHNRNIKLIDPVSFVEMNILQKNADLIITDSGGVQKEAYFLKKPCIVLREETEWVELMGNGSSVLTGANKKRIIDTFHDFSSKKDFIFPELFGKGNAAEIICEELIKSL